MVFKVVPSFIVVVVVVALQLFSTSSSFSAAAGGEEGGGAPFPTEAYGYVPISSSDRSAMFYALYGNPNRSSAQRAMLPLTIWLQGGPGASSMFGNLLEVGPIKLEKNATSSENNNNTFRTTQRRHAWSESSNLLFVDNPVGTGFSYTQTSSGFCTSDAQIGTQLVVFLKGFLQKHPEFNGKDLWIASESYGGKMTAYFGVALMKAGLDVNFKGVMLGDGWIDPVGCMLSYGDYLKTFGLVSTAQAKNISLQAHLAQQALAQGDGERATYYWSFQQRLYEVLTSSVNVYNVDYFYDYTANQELGPYLRSKQFLEGVVGPGVIPKFVVFGAQSNEVFSRLTRSFMRDAITQVQELIDAGLSVNVFNGQLDVIVDNLCTIGWIRKLPWSKLPAFLTTHRHAIVLNKTDPDYRVSLYMQHLDNFRYWQINGAGHMVPLDQPAAAEYMFKYIISNGKISDPKPRPVKKRTVHRFRPNNFDDL